jgi:hypothetical protein
MKKSILSISMVTGLIALESCGTPSEDTWPTPEKRQISSAIQRTPQESLIVAMTSSGGGAGDIIFRILNCKGESNRCELLASVDTNDRPSPTLSINSSGVALNVNKQDYIADFRNFSRELGSVQPGELYLEYRKDAKGTR